MNRKRLFGCGGAALAGLLLLGGFFYVTVFRPSQQVMGDLDGLAGLRGKNAGIRNQASFLPPVDGRLGEADLARFARVQTAIREGLGGDYPFLAERAGRLHGLAPDGEGRLEAKRLGLREAILSLKGLGPILSRSKDLQVGALNAEGYSLSEYRWVRETFYRALGFSRANVYFEDFAAAQEAGAPPPEGHSLPPPLDANRELAAAYGDSARAWFPLLVFGF